MLLLVASAAADQILLPPAEWDALRNEISGDRSWKWTNAISQFDRNIGSDGYVDAMRYVEEVVLDTLPISKSFRSRLRSRGRPIRWPARRCQS